MINGGGALATAVVLAIVLATKFTQGAWIVVLAMPVVFAAMKAIGRHYARLAAELTPAAIGVALPERIHSVVLVSSLNKPVLRALAFATASRPASLTALKVSDDPADPLAAEWAARGVEVPLVVLESPYRETVRPVLRYVAHLRREHPGEVISIVIPEYVVGRWWENLLHNQTALRMKARLRFEPGVVVTSVPWQLER